MTSRFAGPLAAAWGETAKPPSLRRVLARSAARLPVPQATDRATWSLDGGSADRATLGHVLEVATLNLDRPWPHTAASAWRRYFTDGDRREYEAAVFARQDRLTAAVVAAAVTLDDAAESERRLLEVADGVTLLCEQSSWCWPAHDDTHSRDGAVLPAVDSPYLDLGAGEVAAQLAWVDHLLAAPLDERVPGLRRRIRYEVHRRVLDPFLSRDDWHWLGREGRVHNWNPWILGNLVVGTVALVDDPDQQATLLAAALEGLDRYVAALPPDGAVDEGFGYWWNGACRALEVLDLLRHVTAGTLTADDVPSLRATVAFPHRMHLGGDWYLNVADGSARIGDGDRAADLPWRELHRAAIVVGDDEARRHAASRRRPGHPVAPVEGGLGRLLRALTDEVWAAEGSAGSAPPRPPLVRDVWLGSQQLLLARARVEEVGGLCLAVKGGHNDENHNHNDVGEVVIALNGVPVVVDAGRPTYTAQTFGPDRYRIWSMQSAWHNVPEVCGIGQGSGRQHAAEVLRTDITAAVALVELDLTRAYPVDNLRYWRRSARLDRMAAEVTVTDSWELLPSAEPRRPCVLHYLLAGEVERDGEAGLVVRAMDGAGAMVVRWDPASVNGQLVTRELDDPMLTQVWGARLTRLTLDLGVATTGSATVRFREA